MISIEEDIYRSLLRFETRMVRKYSDMTRQELTAFSDDTTEMLREELFSFSELDLYQDMPIDVQNDILNKFKSCFIKWFSSNPQIAENFSDMKNDIYEMNISQPMMALCLYCQNNAYESLKKGVDKLASLTKDLEAHTSDLASLQQEDNEKKE